ncbi:hypothetical protein ACPESV_24715 [Streptomyces umbrinus]|uniref:hypothetical protein n=1 Tax=Streptomyces umbrinus TaxID=67370 RepID=UPI003C2E3C7D
MSAPLVVNTTDGMVWRLRPQTRDGEALYAIEGAPVNCPSCVLATFAELEAHGVAASADVLPMPVGPGPLPLTEQQIEALAAAGNLVVNNEMHEHLCMCDAWPKSCVSTGDYFMGAWDVSGLEAALPAVLGLWESMRGADLVRLGTANGELLDENRRLTTELAGAVHAADAMRAGYEAAPGLRKRVAELEGLLRDATSYAAGLEGRLGEVERVPFSLDADATTGNDPCHPCGCPKRFDRHADGCTASPSRRDACQSCGSLPETWCPDCAVCKAGCFDGFVNNSCSHANASWGGV